jgi:hypothetical protein
MTKLKLSAIPDDRPRSAGQPARAYGLGTRQSDADSADCCPDFYFTLQVGSMNQPIPATRRDLSQSTGGIARDQLDDLRQARRIVRPPLTGS